MARTEPFDKYLNDYENWFEDHKYVYESELEAVRHFIPINQKGIEIEQRIAFATSKVSGLIP